MIYSVDGEYEEEHTHKTEELILQGVLTKVDSKISSIVNFISNIMGIKVVRSCENKNGNIWFRFDLIDFITLMTTAYQFKNGDGFIKDSYPDINLFDFLESHSHRDLYLDFFKDLSDDIISELDSVEDSDLENFIETNLESKANCFVDLSFKVDDLQKFKDLVYNMKDFIL